MAPLLSPLLHLHPRSPAGMGGNLKVVHQTAYTREAQTQAARSGKAIPQGLPDIMDSRTLIGCNNQDTFPRGILDRLQSDLALAGIGDNVAGKFGNCRGDESGINRGKADLHRKRSPALSCRDDILVRGYS